jgi:hypothetical protein
MLSYLHHYRRSSFANIGGKGSQMVIRDDGITVNESRHRCFSRGEGDGEETGTEGATAEPSEEKTWWKPI